MMREVRLAGVTAVSLIMVAVVALACHAPAVAQTALDWDPRGAELGREELRELLDRLEVAAASPGYSGRLKEQARREAEVLRTRLEEGDFQVGDRIVLRVQGEFGDTVAVEPGRVISLPGMDKIPLAGVLRSELVPHLRREISRYIQEPVVEATSLVRIAVLGQVGRQGFYIMPASLLVEEALMLAGGPAARADLDEVEILRGDRVIWDGEGLQHAIVAGRTLDQLSLRAGDRIMVPEQRSGFLGRRIAERVAVALIVPLTYAVIRLIF